MESNLMRLKRAFIEMEKNGFEINSPLKWGFYFTDKNKNKLRDLYNKIKDHQYTIEEFDLIDKQFWQLFVTKIEILTPDKLHRRNIAFNKLAEAMNVATYDGWDVEKAEN